MISFLQGVHGGMEPDGAITVCVGGVGYRVAVADRDRDKVNVRGVGGDVRLWCRTTASENEINIYGFLDEQDRRAFDRLLRVDGVGVSTALRLLSVLHATALKQIVASKQTAALCAVPGIGKKTADKIVEQVDL
jgi:holliday junction DNA helicase RuvA